MIFKDCEIKGSPLDEDKTNNLSIIKTNDGSISLRSKYFNESFHSYEGAHKESLNKFLIPSDLDRFSPGKEINVLDICFGLGYNTGCLLQRINPSNLNLNWWGLEIDSMPLKMALNHKEFRSIWNNETLLILEELRVSRCWERRNSRGFILWGDARKRLSDLPVNLKFDLIFLDPFSPKNCPQLWTEEFLMKVSNKLVEDGRILTYSRAAAIRSTFKKAGLELFSLSSEEKDKAAWSNGTIAFKKDKSGANENFSTKSWRALSTMEEEHLLTRAAIPYRDPCGESSRQQILLRRKKEQNLCEMEATTSWKKRWKIV